MILEYYDALREQLKRCERCPHVNELCGNVAHGEATLDDLRARLRAHCRAYRDPGQGPRASLPRPAREYAAKP